MIWTRSFLLIVETARKHEVNLLLHPVAGEIPADEAEYFAHIHGDQAALPRFPAASTLLALLPLPPHGAGLRQALLKTIVARNYGCTHAIVEDVPEAALQPYHEIVGVQLISLEAPSRLTSQELHRRLDLGLEIPGETSFPEVIAALRRAYPPRHAQGFCVFLTGLSGAGKSTIAKALMARLLEIGGRQVTLLDGDIVRKNLSSELGFSRAHRDLNVRRIGYVASEIVKHRGVAICAPIAPYQATRQDVRHIIEQYGGFFEVHVATPIEVCESRGRKGLYAKARRSKWVSKWGHLLADLRQASKQSRRQRKLPISILHAFAVAKSRPFLQFMAATNRASHPSGSSDQRCSAFALAAWPPQKNVGAAPRPIPFITDSWLPVLQRQPLSGSRCRRSALLLG